MQYLISLLEKCKDLLTSSQEGEESEADESEVLEAKLISEISVKLFSQQESGKTSSIHFNN